MNKIADAFQNGKALITYLMAGDPDLSASARYILTAQEAGADLIEIGIPFSDPIAEGEVIEAASVRALQAGTKLTGVFDIVASIKEQIRVPLLFMTYLNPVYVYGYERFFARCAQIGICGIIIPDAPFEEQGEIKKVAEKYGVDVITLVAPTSQQRVEMIVREAEGFLYLVSSMGVTGVRSEITTDLSGIVAKIKQTTKIPVAVGFGISTPQQAAQYANVADGVIVGSAIVRIIAEYGKSAEKPLRDYIGGMKQAMRNVRS